MELYTVKSLNLKGFAEGDLSSASRIHEVFKRNSSSRLSPGSNYRDINMTLNMKVHSSHTHKAIYTYVLDCKNILGYLAEGINIPPNKVAIYQKVGVVPTFELMEELWLVPPVKKKPSPFIGFTFPLPAVNPR